MLARYCSFAVLAAAALSSCSPDTSGSTLLECEALTAMPAPVAPMIKGTVFTIVIENHSANQVLGNFQAPFLTKIARQYAVARGYHDTYVHPSEANYLWMAAGENFDILDDDDPKAHSLDSTSHIADQIEAAGLTWKSYQESMGEPCGLKSHGRYAAKHNPFVFFNDVNGWDGQQFQYSQRCVDHVVDYAELDKDIAAGTVPNYAFITPNLDHDMHDGSVTDADRWLEREVTKIMASDAYKKGGAIIILGDEGGGFPAADDPPFFIISDLVRQGYGSDEDYDTSSYLKTVQALLGLAPLPCDPARDDVPAMDDLFKVPLTTRTAEAAR